MAEIFREQPCPVADLAIEATHLTRAWQRLDEAGADREQFDAVTEQLDGIETKCARRKPGDLSAQEHTCHLIYFE